MKLVLYDDLSSHPGLTPKVGILKESKVIDISSAIPMASGQTSQQTIEHIIDNFDGLCEKFDRLTGSAPQIPISKVRLRPPLPRPSKILGCIGNYWEHMQREPRPLNMFLKSPEAIIGPGDTVILPNYPASVFHHEAELAIVIRGPAKNVNQSEYKDAVFGYTCFTDVSARGNGRQTAGAGSFIGKSFDTFAPIGPCIATADEIPDPNNLAVKYWVNGHLRHNYTTNDMEHLVPEIVAFATSIMTLNTGDIIACGTNHEGLGPLQDGDVGEIEIAGIGHMSITVSDPLKRSWERGVYMGPGSTAPEARGTV